MNEITKVLTFIWESIIGIWPLLLLTIPLSVGLKEIGISNKINKLMNKNIWVSILLATLIGAVAPFCSCSVIPVIASLLTAGVPVAPVMAFWLASPSMDPEIFFLSVASLGWDLATIRLVATFLMSISGGIVTHFLLKRWNNKDSILKPFGKQTCSSCGCDEPEDKKSKIKRIAKESLTAMLFVFRFLLIAFLLEALIIFYVPTEFISKIFTSNDFLSVIVASFISVPLYTTNISALGIIGGLVEKGLSMGAALAFLVGGATTTIPAMSAVFRLVHRKIFFIYLGITFAFTILSGLIYNLMLFLF